MLIHFPGNPDSPYFTSPAFKTVLGFIQQQGRKFSLRESNGKLRLSTEGINSVSEAKEVLNKMLKSS